MKTHTTWFGILIVTVVVTSCARAQSGSSAPEWKATVKVIDEALQPIANADVTVGYYVPPPPDRTIAMGSVKGRTDTNGLFSAAGHTRSTDLFFGAGKEGYYRSHVEHEFARFKEGDPAKWNPTVTLLLKKTGTPTPMYAKSVNLGMPVFGKPAGFDLMLGDWVAPYGAGVATDIIFTGYLDRRTEFDSDYRLVVSFPRPGDGIREFALSGLQRSSSLRSAHEAPPDGFQSQWVQTDTRKPGRPIETNRDESRNYFFRVRTLQDEGGNVKSALYGKIYGDFMHFRYYLNPTPNDRNVEFDPKHNLLTGLKSFEQVTAP